MGDRLIISDNREDPGNPLVLNGEAIDAAARDPLAIGKLMVDQVWAEGTDSAGCRSLNRQRGLHDRRLGAGAGLVRIHGTHRGVLLVEFLDVPGG
ncbi:hypothetical protein H6G65_12680 [Microcystis elabens FACHB-917]|nr:hypothetical protein [Microcystis elabens FACHB-917]